MTPARSETRLIQVAKRALAEISCPFCRDTLAEGETKTCPGCETLYHPACALELPSCAILGCEAVIGAKTAPRSKEAEAQAILGGVLVVVALLLAPFLPTLVRILAESAEALVFAAVTASLVLPGMVYLYLEA